MNSSKNNENVINEEQTSSEKLEWIKPELTVISLSQTETAINFVAFAEGMFYSAIS